MYTKTMIAEKTHLSVSRAYHKYTGWRTGRSSRMGRGREKRGEMAVWRYEE